MNDGRVDILPLLSGGAGVITFEFPLTPDADFINVSFCGPFYVSGRITNQDGFILLTAEARGEYETVCDRCAAPIRKTLVCRLERPVVRPGTLSEDADPDDYIVVGGDAGSDGDAGKNTVDCTVPMREEIVLEFPTRNLCREDCRGLCQRCGKDLNEGECGCDKKQERNPIWDKVLAEFENN